MATIPVEKKEGTPWWLWLLGLLLLALLIWFFFLRNDDDDVAVVDNTEAVAPVVAETGLNLSDVWVTRVVGDNTFFVSPDSAGTNETLVYLEEEATPGTATEGRYDVTPGQHLSLVGSMMPVGDQDLTAWGLAADQAAMMTPESEYVRATALTVLNGGMAMDEMAGDAMASDAMADGAMAAETPAAATGPITNLADLYAASLTSMIGRDVTLDNATVLSLAGDSTFYVGAGNKKVLVALSGLGESETGPGDGSDGRFNINVGDKVNIRGSVLRFDASNSAFRSLSAADRAAETTRGGFVNVTRASGVTKR